MSFNRIAVTVLVLFFVFIDESYAQHASAIKLESEIYSYSPSRGLFGGVALEGGALPFDHDTTWALYSMSAYDILNRTEFSKLPAEVQEFYKVLVSSIRSSN